MSNRFSISACVFVLLGVPLVASAQIPAFPGADGAGMNVTGGRGGIVYHVTKLDQNYSDAVEGTLRYGLTDSNFAPGTKRTIVFDVAGTFWLGRYGADRGHFDGWDTQSRLNIGTNVTVAGQTAPGPVNIMGGTVKFSDTGGISNSMVRNVLVAPGYGMRSFEKPDEDPPVYPDPGNPVLGSPATPRDYPDSYTYDAFDITAKNVMIDHVSTFYATDETVSINEFGGDITVQYTNISQGQNYPQADAESTNVRYTGHALGSLFQAGSNAKVSIINDLYAHLAGRIPRVGSEVGTGPFNDFRNNVFYNWLSPGTGGSGQPSFNNFINNFYLVGHGGNAVSQTAGEDGVNGTLDDLPVITTVGASSDPFNGNSVTRVYASGNLRDTNLDGDANDGTSADGLYGGLTQSTAYSVNIGVTLDANAAFDNVMNYVGSRWWERDGTVDSIDERIINETRTGTGKVVSWADDPFNDYEFPPDPNYDPWDPNEGAEWRDLLSYRADPADGSAPFNRAADWDSDGDGMPNYWEDEHGLNHDVANNNDDFDNDGYTDLEEYLNDMAAWPAPGPIVFSGSSNSRYEQIQNWEVSGEDVSIAGSTVTTKSKWQPSRYDEAQINGGTVTVDSVGQHAGTLKIGSNPGDSATLNITGGWLKVEDAGAGMSTGEVIIGADPGATAALNLSGGRLRTEKLSKGAGGSFSFTGGVLSADEVDFDLVSDGGTISPGESPGQTHVVGNLTINSGGVLIELASASIFDTILVDDTATLGGNLSVAVLDSFEPSGSDVFEILTADTLLGTFANAATSVFAGVGTFDVTYTPTSVLLSNFVPFEGLLGDYNGDFVVDAADYTAWRDAMTAGATDLPNDPTPGVVDESDFLYWRAHFGETAAGSGQGLASVPEPASVLLAVVGWLVTVGYRRTAVR